jgi:hypothetical protein
VRIPARWFAEPVTVQTYDGEGAYGPLYIGSLTVNANVEDVRVLVRNKDGDETVSETTIRVPPAIDIDGVTQDLKAAFAAESTVTVRGRITRVISTSLHAPKGVPVFVEVHLA